MPARLSNEDREIRQGRGISFRRYWPIPFLLIVVMAIGCDTPLIERCTGLPIADGKGAGVAGFLLALPCSVYLPTGTWWEKLLFGALLLAVPFAILNYRWSQRHEAYWNKIRVREAERRAEKRRQRARD